MISTDRSRAPKKAERPCLIILLARLIVTHRLRRQSTRQRRVLHFVAPREGDKRRRRAADDAPDRAPRFKPVNQHLWSKPMIDLERLLKQLDYLTICLDMARDRANSQYTVLQQLRAQTASMATDVRAELSRLHEKQPEV